MSGNLVVPIVITYRTGDPDMVAAYEIAERAQKAKIEGWAETFEFKLSEPVYVDLPTKPASDKTINEIIDKSQGLNCDGIVAASTEYLRVAVLYGNLPDAVRHIGKRVWIADLGSLPLEDRISA
jgi:hypothetical protein